MVTGLVSVLVSFRLCTYAYDYRTQPKTAADGPLQNCSFHLTGFVLCDTSSCWTKPSPLNIGTQFYSKSAWRASMLSHMHSTSLRHAALHMQLTHAAHEPAHKQATLLCSNWCGGTHVMAWCRYFTSCCSWSNIAEQAWTLQSKPGHITEWVSTSEQGLNFLLNTCHISEHPYQHTGRHAP